MALVIRSIAEGQSFKVYAFGQEDACPLFGFLAELEGNQWSECAKVWALIDRVAQQGVLRNTQKCRFFKGRDLFELKTPGGVRVLAFYDEGRMIICSHGFLKKSQKTPPGELDKAERHRTAYFAAKSEGKLVIKESDDG